LEIYGGRCQDLLNSRHRLNVREDGAGEVVVSDLMELQADNVDGLSAIIDTGNKNRTTHATESSDESSRSHAICQIALRAGEQLVGRLFLIDLAGSERGADTKSHNRQRRIEGAEINKSLLALKECIRALDSNLTHIPYRASKLTLVLKDSFTNKKSRTLIIANVSPAASSADHTVNTLRYADRIKERVVGGMAAKNAAAAAQLPPPSSNLDAGKNKVSRNRDIQKALADNIASPDVVTEAESKASQQLLLLQAKRNRSVVAPPVPTAVSTRGSKGVAPAVAVEKPAPYAGPAAAKAVLSGCPSSSNAKRPSNANNIEEDYYRDRKKSAVEDNDDVDFEGEDVTDN
jgi:hypothetical protein